MAGDWIKMRSNLDTDPRVISMAAQLGIPELHVIGCLWKVWSWADSHTLDGNAIRVTDVTLDRFTSVTGFADALRKVGWLEGRDSALSFPRFAEHNGQTAKKRGETAIRVAKHRNAKSVTDVTQKVLPEKRREEKRNISISIRDEIEREIPERFRTGEMLDALTEWATAHEKHPENMNQTKFTGTDARNLLMAQSSAGWDHDKIIRCMYACMARKWKNLRDTDEPPPRSSSGPYKQKQTGGFVEM